MFVRSLLLCALALSARAFAGDPPPPVFEFDEYLVAPLRVHFLLSETEPALCTTLTDADVARIFGKVNRIWQQAGIGFVVESNVREKPEPDEAAPGILPGELGWLPRHILPANYSPDLFHVYYLKQFKVNGIYYPKAIFVKDLALLRKVEGGIDEPIPRVTSHEIGHALGLPHRQDTFNLMASGTTGNTFNAGEIEIARKTAAGMARFKNGPDWLAKVDELRRAGQEAEALDLEARLVALPMETPKLHELRERLHAGAPPKAAK